MENKNNRAIRTGNAFEPTLGTVAEIEAKDFGELDYARRVQKIHQETDANALTAMVRADRQASKDAHFAKMAARMR